MSFSFEGRTALVTGAARGLGRAVADELERRGARVVATDREPRGPESAVLELDVTEPEQIRDLRERLREETGGVDILVNNAGVVHGGAFLDQPLEQHRRTYRVNVEGVVAMTHAFLPDLIAAPQGRLVNIASVAGFLGLPFAVTYSSSKWAVVGFSEGIRLELAELGHEDVRVTMVCPAYIRTGMFAGARPAYGTRVLEAGEVARAVVDATARGQRRLLLPPIARTAPLGIVLPRALSDFLSRRLGITTSMRSWRGRAEDPGGRG